MSHVSEIYSLTAVVVAVLNYRSDRRAQYLVAGSNVPSNSETPVFDDDEESQAQLRRRPFLDDEDEDFDAMPSTLAHDDPFIGQLDWDEDYEPPKEETRVHRPILSPPVTSILGEEAPLLAKKPSRVLFWNDAHPMTGPSIPQDSQDQVPNYLSAPPLCRRRMSGASVISSKNNGQSTYGQTVCVKLNCRMHTAHDVSWNLSCSIPLLSFLAWECCPNHWRLHTPVGLWAPLLSSHMVSWRVIRGLCTNARLALVLANDLCSAKILARIILSDPRIRSYSDIGRKAFGPVATPIISFMFCLELFAVRSVRLRSDFLSRFISCRSVCLVTLYGDSLHSLLPQQSSNYYKALGLVL